MQFPACLNDYNMLLLLFAECRERTNGQLGQLGRAEKGEDIV
jgi:hypothetical protein